MAAADNFFNTDSANPPQRVDGPPFDSATALVDGTSANTVQWYIGEDSTSPARTSVSARIDPAIVVNYGMRANEQALRLAVQNIAVFAAASFDANDPNASEAYTALGLRVGSALDGAQDQQKVSDIGAEIAGAQTYVRCGEGAASADLRHADRPVAEYRRCIAGRGRRADSVALQTSLQASLQTTAMLSKMSLVNFLQ